MFGTVGMVVALCLAFGLVIYFAIMYIREVVKARITEREHQIDIKEQRADAVKRSRSVIEGLTFEQLAPHFKEWKYGKPSDARFIASPLDYVVFSGLSENNVKEIIFVEVKTGKSQVTKRQKSVRDAIKNGKVKYELLELE